MDEQRLVIWSGLPADSLLTVSVDGGQYTVQAEGRLKQSTGITYLKLGPAELVNNKFELPIKNGTNLRLTIWLTYLSKDETSALVYASVTDAAGDPVEIRGVPCIFAGEYTGSIGGDSPEDEVTMFVAGEQ